VSERSGGTRDLHAALKSVESAEHAQARTTCQNVCVCVCVCVLTTATMRVLCNVTGRNLMNSAVSCKHTENIVETNDKSRYGKNLLHTHLVLNDTHICVP